MLLALLLRSFQLSFCDQFINNCSNHNIEKAKNIFFIFYKHKKTIVQWLFIIIFIRCALELPWFCDLEDNNNNKKRMWKEKHNSNERNFQQQLELHVTRITTTTIIIKNKIILTKHRIAFCILETAFNRITNIYSLHLFV